MPAPTVSTVPDAGCRVTAATTGELMGLRRVPEVLLLAMRIFQKTALVLSFREQS
jgi:hypothetical protein